MSIPDLFKTAACVGGFCLLGALCTAGELVRAGDKDPLPLAVGDALPRLEGEYLTGRDALLPDAVRGKIVLLALGFSYDSRFPVEEWSKKFRAAFAGDPGVTFIEIPMIGGMGMLGRPFINRGMRKGTPAELHENVITVYGGTGPWKRRLSVRNEKLAYLLLLDREGKIRWIHSGLFEEARLLELTSLARTLQPKGN